MPFDRKQLLADILSSTEKIENLRLANAIYIHLLKNYNSDEWNWWTGFLDTFEKIKLHPIENTEIFLEFPENKIQLNFIDKIEEAKQFFKSLQNSKK